MTRWGRTLFLCLSACVVSLQVSSAAPVKPTRGGILRQALSQSVASLDPALCQNDQDRTIAMALYDSLMAYDPKTGALTLNLARTVQLSSDGRVLRIGLRKGVLFSNGKEMVASDVKFSFDRVADPRTGSPGRALLEEVSGFDEFAAGKPAGLSGVKVVDEYTVQVTLVKPSIFFLAALAEPALSIVSAEQVGQNGRVFKEKPLGTGPFKVGEFRPDYVSLVRNDRYRNEGVPYLDGLRWTAFESFKQTYDAFVSGGIDVIDLSPEWFELLKERGKWNSCIQSWPAPVTFYLGFNLKRPPFDKPEIRQAIARAFNPTAYVGLRGGGGQVADGVLPPSIGGYNPARKRPGVELKEAKAMLARAGYPDGKNFPVVNLCGQGYSGLQKRLLEQVKRDLEGLGLKVQIRLLAPADFETSVRRGDADVFSYGWKADYPDPHNFLFNLFSSTRTQSTNLTGYSNPQVDSLLEKARAEREAKTRVTLYQQVEDIVLKDTPLIPIFHPLYIRAHQPYVKGCVVHPVVPFFFDTLWFDKH